MAVAAVEMSEDLASRPALRAWNAAHERERKRMGFPTYDAYAAWAGVDPALLSKWRRGKRPVPAPAGRKLVALFDHDPRWEGLWLRLWQEQELLALRQERGPRLRVVGTRGSGGPAAQG